MSTCEIIMLECNFNYIYVACEHNYAAFFLYAWEQNEPTILQLCGVADFILVTNHRPDMKDILCQ